MTVHLSSKAPACAPGTLAVGRDIGVIHARMYPGPCGVGAFNWNWEASDGVNVCIAALPTDDAELLWLFCLHPRHGLGWFTSSALRACS